MNHYPLVSVPVITYNSSKFVIETLESVKSQTYQNIELIVSDDGSTDGTVELCKEWVERNKTRFNRVELLTVEHNTGTSGNMNRAEAACHGDWVKGIAGDDKLLPNCITDFINYTMTHPEAVCIFGRLQAIGADLERCKHFEENVFCHSFFDLTSEQQLENLIFNGNNIPAATCFHNRTKFQQLGIINDERIPLIEDWPKWINVLKKGVKFHFLDKQVVQYRLVGISTQTRWGLRYYDSLIKTYCLYCYPIWQEKGDLYAAQRISNLFGYMYEDLLSAEVDLQRVLNSKAYRFGTMVFKPIRFMNHLFRRKG